MQSAAAASATGANSTTNGTRQHGGMLDLTFAQTNAERSNKMYTFTNPPSSFQTAPCFKRATRFQPNIAAQEDDLHHVPYFNGSRLQSQAQPGPGTYSPHKQASVVLNGSHIEQYEGRLGNPSATRPSFFSRRVKTTTPMVGGPAQLSLNGADRLLEPPAPGPGTYEQPDSVFKESVCRDGQFLCPSYGKGRNSAPYKSRSARFTPTRDESDANARPTGLPEGRGARPLVKARGMRVRWIEGLQASEGLRREGVLRLGKATQGFARGTTQLPGPGAWLASLYVKTPESITPKSWSWQDESDGVVLLVNGAQVATVGNEPGKMVPVTFSVSGSSFDWEFRFSSSHKHFAHHPIVMDGTVRCDAVAHVANPRRPRHQGRPFPAVSDTAAPSISQSFLLGSIKESARYAQGAAPLDRLLYGGSSSPQPRQSGAPATTTGQEPAMTNGGGALPGNGNNLAAMQAYARSVREAKVQGRERQEDEDCVRELEKFVEPNGSTPIYR